MKVAAIQFNATADKSRNLARAQAFIDQAARRGARLIVLPEVFIFRGPLKNRSLDEVAETILGPTMKRLAEAARKNKVFILAGSIYEKSHKAGRAYNTSALISDRGKIAAKYRKINLFNAVLGKKKIRESDFFVPGKTLAMARIDGFHAGLSVCFDLRFPHIYQTYAQRGAQILFVPSVFTRKTGQAHWEVLLRARAIENQCYIIAPNQIGRDSRGVPSFGHSMIVSPWGEILAEASADKEEIIYADISSQAILQAKKILPLLKKVNL